MAKSRMADGPKPKRLRIHAQKAVDMIWVVVKTMVLFRIHLYNTAPSI